MKLSITKLRTGLKMRKQQAKRPQQHQLGLDVIEVVFEELLAQLVHSQALVMFTEYAADLHVHMLPFRVRRNADYVYRVKS
jgi:hypothetical protein